MIKTNKRKSISFLLILALMISIFSFQSTLAAEGEPDLTLYVHGEKSNGGPIFHSNGKIGNGLWAPGATQKGTIRLLNNYSERIKVTNMGLRIKKLEKLQNGTYTPVTDHELYDKYAKTMKLTIKKGALLIFSNTIYDYSFYEMLYKENDSKYKGYELPLRNQFSVNKNKEVDLEYTVHMDESAGNEMQGIRATVDFLINVHEYPEPTDNDDDDNNDDIDDAEQLEEEPIEVIPDIAGHWAHDCIVALVEHGIVKGYPDGTIRPENYITRAETAVLIGRALQLQEKEKFFSGYIDSIPDWAKGYIVATTEADIFEGYPGFRFKAGKNISREEMLTVLVRGFKKESVKNAALNFIDSKDVGDWAVEYVRIGVEHELIVGYPDNTFKPQQSITRAEAFTIICKLLGYHEEHNINNE